MADNHIVILGNLGQGFSAHGPFDDYNQALAFGEDSKDDWHVMELHAPPAHEEVDITKEGAPIHISADASIMLDEENEYVLFCPNIHAAMKAGRSESDVLRSIKGLE